MRAKFLLGLLGLLISCYGHDEWCFSTSGECLLWQANQNGLDIGVTGAFGTPPVINGTVFTPSATSYQPGYRLAADFLSHSCTVGVHAEYLALTLDHQFGVQTPDDLFVSAQTWYFDTNPFSAISSHWRLGLRWADLEGIARWNIDRRFSIVLGAGLRMLWLDQHFDLRSKASGDGIIYDTFYRSDARGIGLKFDMTSPYRIQITPSLFLDVQARSALSFPYLHYNVRSVTPVPSLGEEKLTIKNSVRFFRTIAQLGVGATIGYATPKRPFWTLSYFYDWNLFWKQDMMRGLVDLANPPTGAENIFTCPGDLYLQGHTISLRLGF